MTIACKSGRSVIHFRLLTSLYIVAESTTTTTTTEEELVDDVSLPSSSNQGPLLPRALKDESIELTKPESYVVYKLRHYVREYCTDVVQCYTHWTSACPTCPVERHPFSLALGSCQPHCCVAGRGAFRNSLYCALTKEDLPARKKKETRPIMIPYHAGVKIFFQDWPCSTKMKHMVDIIIDELVKRQQEKQQQQRQQQRSSDDRLLQGVAYLWAYYLPLPDDLRYELCRVYEETFRHENPEDARLVECKVFSSASLASSYIHLKTQANYERYLPGLVVCASLAPKWSATVSQSMGWADNLFESVRTEVIKPSSLDKLDYHSQWWLRSVYIALIAYRNNYNKYSFENLTKELQNKQRLIESSKHHIPQTPCDIMDTIILGRLQGKESPAFRSAITYNCHDQNFVYPSKKENWLGFLKSDSQLIKKVVNEALSNPLSNPLTIELLDDLEITISTRLFMHHRLYGGERHGEAETVMREMEELWLQILKARSELLLVFPPPCGVPLADESGTERI